MLAPDRRSGESFSGTSACLSALYKAERYEELVEVAGGEHVFWADKIWAVRALAAQGRRAEALRLAESSRGPWSSDLDIDRLGEEILLYSGMVEDAYRRYGLSANRAGTYLATFRAVAKRYPLKAPETILKDLVATTPSQKMQAWIDARQRYRLSHAQIQMARELEMNPRKLGELDNRDQEPWKMPLGRYLEHLYLKRFGNERPDLVLSIEEKILRDEAKKASKKERKEARRRAKEEGGASR